MGCCEAKNVFDLTDNEIENEIRRALYSIHRKKIDYDGFDEKYKKIMSLSITDIHDGKWYSQENYNKIINCIFKKQSFEENEKNEEYYNTDEKEKEKERELVNMKNGFTNVIINPQSDYDKKNFHINFLFQIISFLDDDLEVKLELLDKSARDFYKVFSMNNFKKFLIKYLEINLIYTTQSFIENKRTGKIEETYLVNNVFTKNNIEIFSQSMISTMERIIVKSKPFLQEDGINNEFIRPADFKEFFFYYKILLENLELRKYFYDKFSINSNLNLENQNSSISKSIHPIDYYNKQRE